MEFKNYLHDRWQRINQLLDTYLPSAALEPQQLHAAMRHLTMNSGKRIRPLLVYASGEVLGANLELLGAPASAIELIHTYSLIHDDLPAMDNDDLRRGQPTVHKAFDEATAILAGDTLFNLGFQLLAEANQLPEHIRINMITTLTQACGSIGMAGGQALDLMSNQGLSLEQLENIHNLKTGALIRASISLGAQAANATEQQLEHLDEFAQAIGLVFQIQDDIFDAAEITNDHQASYVAILGLDQAKSRLQELQQQALRALNRLDLNCDLLLQLTNHIMQRKF